MDGKPFHRIVIPADFSNSSEEAWALAQRVAESLGSEVVLVHVFAELPHYGDAPLGHTDTTGRAFETARKWTSEALEKMAARAREKGIKVRTVMRTGVPHQEIVDVVTNEGADLVMMGTHGRSGLSRVLLGSVAERVIHFAPCPVLTVRRPD
jgi:nucleotide-binding universal stress UspA family protein